MLSRFHRHLAPFILGAFALVHCGGKVEKKDEAQVEDGIRNANGGQSSVDGDGDGGAGVDGDGDMDLCSVANGDVNDHCPDKVPGPSQCPPKASWTASSSAVNLLLVVDKSAELLKESTVEGGATSWETTQGELMGALCAAEEANSFGLLLYHAGEAEPSCESEETCCQMPKAVGVDVPIGGGAEVKRAIEVALDEAEQGGSAPVTAALAQAHEYYKNGVGRDLAGRRSVLLMMAEDPGEGCDAPTLSQIEELKELGVGTFVVGLPGSEPYAALLNQLAIAGGFERAAASEKYFKVQADDHAESLATTLDEIIRPRFRNCDLQLGNDDFRLNALNIVIDCELLPITLDSSEPPGGNAPGQGGDGSGGESVWIYDDTTQLPTIRIRGPACTMIETRGVEHIDPVFGCQISG